MERKEKRNMGSEKEGGKKKKAEGREERRGWTPLFRPSFRLRLLYFKKSAFYNSYFNRYRKSVLFFRPISSADIVTCKNFGFTVGKFDQSQLKCQYNLYKMLVIYTSQRKWYLSRILVTVTYMTVHHNVHISLFTIYD
jgi:hypothetical protein